MSEDLKPCQYSSPQISSAIDRVTLAAINNEPSYLRQIDCYLALWALKNIVRAAPENKPLTLEQLRQRDGQSVYCAGYNEIVLVYIDEDDGIWVTFANGDRLTAESCINNADCKFYFRKPEKVDERKWCIAQLKKGIPGLTAKKWDLNVFKIVKSDSDTPTSQNSEAP